MVKRVFDEEIYKILQDSLSDFEKFLRYLGKFVGEEIS